MPARSALVVADRALARLAAHEAARTPGVTRLHPSPVQAARDAVRRTGDRLGRTSRAGIPAVDVERGPGTGTGHCTVTVRVTTATTPPVLETIAAVQQRVAGTLLRLAETEATVVIQVLDVESGG